MQTLIQDLRYGGRMLLHKPGFTFVAVLTLALGIGANTAIFSVVNAVLLKPLPYHEPERLVMIYGNYLTSNQLRMNASVAEFSDYREQARSFERLAAFEDFSANLSADGSGEPERVLALLATPELFEVLQVSPLKGRAFLSAEAQAGRDDVILIGHDLWQRRFGGDAGIVGRKVILNGRSVTIIGVMPPGFAFSEQAELWQPAVFPPDQFEPSQRGSRGLSVVGRLKRGVSVAAVQAEMDSIAANFIKQYPQNYRVERRWAISVVSLLDVYVGDVRQSLLVLLGAVICVLLMACTNVANLLLAQSAARRREIAIRLALGAGRWRIARQLLTESVMLALAGGAVGVLLAVWGVGLLLKLTPDNLPRLHEVSVDGRVLAFTLLASLLSGVLFGLAPALSASRPDLNETLKEGGRSEAGSGKSQRLRHVFVIAEVALALVLLVSAGLMLKSFWRLQAVDPGFNADGVLTMRLLLPYETHPQPTQRAAFYQQTLERVKALPGVETVSAASRVPLTPGNNSGTISGENSAFGPQDLPIEAEWRWVTPDYFKTMSITILNGRAFTEADTEGAPLTAIVDETFARRFYPNEDAIGKRIKRGGLASSSPWMTIVGVARHVKSQRLNAESRVQVYFPFYQNPSPFNMSLVVGTRVADPLSLTAAVRRAVQSVDSRQPVYSISTLRQIVADSVASQRLAMLLLAVFAAVALLLAVVGIYGVMAYSVTQRTHEIGIRLALGAQAGDVLKLVLKQGLALTLIGIAIGLAAAVALTRVMTGLLFDVSATDPTTYLLIAGLLTFVALLASYLPALRATKVDPMVALRCE